MLLKLTGGILEYILKKYNKTFKFTSKRGGGRGRNVGYCKFLKSSIIHITEGAEKIAIYQQVTQLSKLHLEKQKIIVKVLSMKAKSSDCAPYKGAISYIMKQFDFMSNIKMSR